MSRAKTVILDALGARTGWGEHLPPHPDGQRFALQVTIDATATTEVACPTCNVAVGEPCVWEPGRNVPSGRVHRYRLRFDFEDQDVTEGAAS